MTAAHVQAVAEESDTLVGSGTLVDRAVAELAALHHLVEQTLGVDSAANWLVVALVVVGVGWGSSSARDGA